MVAPTGSLAGPGSLTGQPADAPVLVSQRGRRGAVTGPSGNSAAETVRLYYFVLT
jgi:hypothetical protein